MMSKSFLVFTLVLLVSSVLADEDHKPQQETKPVIPDEVKDATKEMKTGFWGWGGGGSGGGGGGGGTYGGGGGGSTYGGGGGGGSSGKGWSYGWSHGGASGGGQKCHFGCCSESFGWSKGGGYYGCKCCYNEMEAKAYMESKSKAQTKN